MVRIWDLPTRLFHWLFAVACTVAWVTGDEPRYTDLHVYADYVALGLVLFRVVWGVVGGRYARFSQFVKGPAAILRHWRRLSTRSRSDEPGHNPAGAVAILLMLSVAGVSGVTGLVVLGGEEGFGPLAGMVGIERGVQVHGWHEALSWVLVALVVLHLFGVALESLLLRQNLPRAMVTGMKRVEGGEAEPHNAALTAKLLLAAFAAFSAGWFFPYLQGSDEQPYLPFVGAALKQDTLWRESCGECHLSYSPSLMPFRSWQRLLNGQDDHFGEDLFLSPETIALLRLYAFDNSAERVSREVSWRTMRSLDADVLPLRITDTPYWQTAHRGIDEAVWRHPMVNGKFNCGACHRDAEQGGFMNGAMRLPNE